MRKKGEDRMRKLALHLISEDVLRSREIINALERVDRADFVAPTLANEAYDDVPLPIGEDQTISQPYTVVFMLELLRPRKGDRIFEVGSGSAWQTALLANIVGDSGKVYAAERIPSLCELGKKNLRKYSELFRRVEWFCMNAISGLPDIAEKIGAFDGIIAAAELYDAPVEWRRELKIGGRLVYPYDHTIVCETRREENKIDTRRFQGFSFVPFVGQT
jgi:protein-L-isoaspartate(D-aspartate) O-methyltransferase